MAERSGEQALFGAAVLVRKLEQAGLSARGHQVVGDVLADLGLTMEQVERYLRSNEGVVDAALARGRRDP